MKSGKAQGIGILLLLVLAAGTARSVLAQPSDPKPATIVNPKVTAYEGNLEADDLILVEIDGLADWAKGNEPDKLVPYLNGLAISGNYPIESHTSQNHLRFHLRITPENKKTWVDLLGAPSGLHHAVSLSVGLENQSQFDTVFDRTHPVQLTVISRWYGVVALIVVLGTLALLLGLARKTNILREPGPIPIGGKLRPYNLGRTQMAFWFFLTYASYVTIWLITDALDTITPSLLGLIGISAATALSAALIDSGKDAATASSLLDLTAERQALDQTIPPIQEQIAAVQAKPALAPEEIANRDALNKQLLGYRTRLAQVSQEIEAVTPPASASVSGGFLRDVLGDENGYSFHRFQMFAWTIVLGVMFVSSVYNSLSMPEFSTTLLGLMGISSGTYIGFKFPEQR
jgi:hypothetical protein